MIVSASYRTDIPAFYGQWFLNRFRAGWAKAVNPYGGRVSIIALRAGVDGFVFWTRNVAPFRPVLDEVRAAGYPFVVHYTATGYPRILEAKVADTARSVALMHDLAGRFGPRAVVWRYDPVLITSLTPPVWHLDNFARLADGLAGAVDEVSVSFAQIYKKTRRNLDKLGLPWDDPPVEDQRQLLLKLWELAAARGIRLTVCSQPHLLGGALQGSICVDARRIEDVAAGWGRPRSVPARIKGNRPGCLCFESRDLGDYDSCPHGCAYCYAVGSHSLARSRFATHDPESEFLFPPPGLLHGNNNAGLL